MNVAKIASGLVAVGLLTGGGAALLARSSHTAATSQAPASTAPAATHAATAAKPVTTKPAAAVFNTWMDGTGRTLLTNDFSVLSQAKSDAAAQNVAALRADASALVTAGKASLADPPPAHAASWNAAFAAMVRAGEDLQAGNLAGAVAESSVVEANIYAFNGQSS